MYIKGVCEEMKKEEKIYERPWKMEHCLNCANMRKDYARDPWGNPGNTYCIAYQDYLGSGVWMFVLKLGCKHFKHDSRRNIEL